MSLREPPWSREAEVSVLGAILLRPECMHSFELRSDEFYLPAHRFAYEAMVSLVFEDHRPVDLTTLTEALRAAGRTQPTVEEITDWAARTPTAENVIHYANIVRRTAIARRVIVTLSEQTANAYNCRPEEVMSFVQRMHLELSSACDVRARIAKLGESGDELWRRLNDEGDPDQYRIRTGIEELDRFIGGLPTGHVTMIGGRPSMGKSTLARCIAHNIAKRGVPSLLISLEDSDIDSLQCLWLRSAGDMELGDRILQKRMRQSDFAKLATARDTVAKLPIYICDEPGLTAVQICQRIRQAHAALGIKVAFVDYLTLVSMPGENDKRHEVDDAVKLFVAVAKDLDIAVVILSQLKRDAGREKRAPELEDFRESGGIEEAANVAIGVHRPWKYKPDMGKRRLVKLMECIVLKIKMAETGTAKCFFEGACYDVKSPPEGDYFDEQNLAGPLYPPPRQVAMPDPSEFEDRSRYAD